MGDRKNPIKFGPEWLRNLPEEQNSGAAPNNSNAAPSSAWANPGGIPRGNPVPANYSSAGSSVSAASTVTAANDTSTLESDEEAGAVASSSNTAAQYALTSKIMLAKLRYGREEMLALYDKSVEPPFELKRNDVLYQSRGIPPLALHNTFEEEMRENIRPPLLSGVGMPLMEDRLNRGRVSTRSSVVSDRGRLRMPNVRPGIGRGASQFNLANQRMVGVSIMPEEEPPQSSRAWNNNSTSLFARNSNDQSDRNTVKVFRSKRQDNSTNWRQENREESSDEWRSQEPGRSRSVNIVEREWGDRQRRPWTGEQPQHFQHSHEDLPEWFHNSDTAPGTFDSSGAFQGFSNDDTNLPRTQDTAHPLTRSRTHGSFARTRNTDDATEVWWASEKAQKLSPKRFVTGDNFKKPTSSTVPVVGASTVQMKHTGSTSSLDEEPVILEKPVVDSSTSESAYKPKFERKAFDTRMRTHINLEEASDQAGNFQSVMITPNNSLRQKHQNIVPSSEQQKFADETIVDEILHLTLEDQSASAVTINTVITTTAITSGMSSNMVNSRSQTPYSNNSTTGMVTVSNVPPARLYNIPQIRYVPVVNSSIIMGQRTSGMGMPDMPNPSMGNTAISNMTIINPGMNNTPINNPSMSGTNGNPINATDQCKMAATGINATMTNSTMNTGITNNTMTHGMGNVRNNAGTTNRERGAVGIGNPMMFNAQMNNGTGNTGLVNAVAANAGMSNNGISNSAMGASIITGVGMPGFQAGAMPGMSAANIANLSNNTQFHRQDSNNTQTQMSNHGSQANLFQMSGLQHAANPTAYGSMYGNLMHQMQPIPNTISLVDDQWYYEDPDKNIQGPFSSAQMHNWYHAGFFAPNMLVRRACETQMRPLGSYGPMPFGSHDALVNNQSRMSLDMMNLHNVNVHDNSVDSLQFGSVGMMRTSSYGQPSMVNSLWSQPNPADLLWVDQSPTARNEQQRVQYPLIYWNQSTGVSNSMLPEEIAKEMKTEDQILAQLRASQNVSTPQNVPFAATEPVDTSTTTKLESSNSTATSVTPNLEELHKLIKEETLPLSAPTTEPQASEKGEIQVKNEKTQKAEQIATETNSTNNKKTQTVQNKATAEIKSTKQAKSENEKSIKNKDNNNKNKNKKSKEEKKEEPCLDVKPKEEETAKTEVKSAEEPSSIKAKKEESPSKKEIEKEKKDCFRNGFISDKDAEKTNKKRVEESRPGEGDALRRWREKEKMASDEEKKRKQAEALKKQQEQIKRPVAGLIVKRSPWSTTNQAMHATNKDGLTFAEIQRLEREKKVEQMKEQQQMMQIIAQQQAAALAREQEMAKLAWAKKMGINCNVGTPSLAEIQSYRGNHSKIHANEVAGTAEARRQSANGATSVHIVEETRPAPAPANAAPWTNNQSAGTKDGFWDRPSISKTEKPAEPRPAELSKPKKKNSAIAKMVATPSSEFELWCNTALATWTSTIDVQTFFNFLRDIESPYEVKDYVKCYLGDTKETSDFARQFLERRSKLLRVGMVTPSDDLSVPAPAVNPRTTTGSDQEVKGKGKKNKKNKMLKVDARILGFSVTASEDRINVGRIDRA